jgi:hypothetical protein
MKTPWRAKSVRAPPQSPVSWVRFQMSPVTVPGIPNTGPLLKNGKRPGARLPGTRISSELAARDRRSIPARSSGRHAFSLAMCNRRLLFCRALLAGKMAKVAQSCVRRGGPSHGKQEKMPSTTRPIFIAVAISPGWSRAPEGVRCAGPEIESSRPNSRTPA